MLAERNVWLCGRSGVCLVLLVSACVSAAERRGLTRHPVLEHKIDPKYAATYERRVERVMGMSEGDVLSFVPDRPLVRFCYCPNCHGGSQGNSVYTWSVDRPDELKCRYCGMVFPNDEYPCDRTIEGKNALGETFTYRYHQDQSRDDLRIFIPGHILRYERRWVMQQARMLAVAYHATKKEKYARRVVLILDRIAQVYPHYPVMRQWITTFKFQQQKPPYSGAGGKWGRWMASELPSNVPATYDLVYDSPEFGRLSKIRGYDVRQRFERGFLRATWEYVNTFKRHTGNMAPSYLRTAVQIGKVIGEPDYVHWAHRWLMEILMGGCFYDGVWHEAPSYHYQVMGGLRGGFAALKGYSDPPEYVNEETGRRFDNLEPDRDIAFFAKAQDAPAAVGFPNGFVAPIHDTWANARRHRRTTATASAILPGYGHAALGCGMGVNQMQAHLHFSGCYGHAHHDCLNLMLFAKDREMLCDIGYTHTKLRNFTISTMGHNLVVVDRKGQRTRGADGDLLAYFPSVNGIGVVEADGARAYANVGGLDRYRRMLILVPVSATDAYVVDIFRVRGGSVHDWILHGSANHDMIAECGLRLTGKSENLLERHEKWVEPRTERSRFNCYGVIRKVATGQTEGDVVTTLTYVEEPSRGVRVHLMAGATTEVFLGRSPSIRRAGSDSKKVWDFWMPQLVARRAGAAPFASTFVAVEEPFAGKPFISRAQAVPVAPADEGAVALRVAYGHTVDTIICTLDREPYPERTTSTGVAIRGRLGIVRQVAGKTTGLWLFEGHRLAAGSDVIDARDASHKGRIVAATRGDDGAAEDAFLVDTELPAGRALSGAWMVVTHGNGYKHGYEISHVAKRDGKTVVALTMDHGLRIEGGQTHEIFYPRRAMPGENTFTIPMAASARTP